MTLFVRTLSEGEKVADMVGPGVLVEGRWHPCTHERDAEVLHEEFQRIYSLGQSAARRNMRQALGIKK